MRRRRAVTYRPLRSSAQPCDRRAAGRVPDVGVPHPLDNPDLVMFDAAAAGPPGCG
jgi:hypothetical protein